MIIDASSQDKPSWQLLGLRDSWKGLGSKDWSLRLGSLETGSEDLCVGIYWTVFLGDTPVREQGKEDWVEGEADLQCVAGMPPPI